MLAALLRAIELPFIKNSAFSDIPEKAPSDIFVIFLALKHMVSRLESPANAFAPMTVTYLPKITVFKDVFPLNAFLATALTLNVIPSILILSGIVSSVFVVMHPVSFAFFPSVEIYVRTVSVSISVSSAKLTR